MPAHRTLLLQSKPGLYAVEVEKVDASG